jgi:hypothetical protein
LRKRACGIRRRHHPADFVAKEHQKGERPSGRPENPQTCPIVQVAEGLTKVPDTKTSPYV